MTKPLQQGAIVWAEVKDPRGRNPKQRPLLVISANEDIVAGEPIRAVAITSSFDDPLPEHHVELPYQADGRGHSGLRKRSVAKCDWLVELQQTAKLTVCGWLSQKKTLEVVQHVIELRGSSFALRDLARPALTPVANQPCTHRTRPRLTQRYRYLALGKRPAILPAVFRASAIG